MGLPLLIKKKVGGFPLSFAQNGMGLLGLAKIFSHYSLFSISHFFPFLVVAKVYVNLGHSNGFLLKKFMCVRAHRHTWPIHD
jgi:hypothetical protein